MYVAMILLIALGRRVVQDGHVVCTHPRYSSGLLHVPVSTLSWLGPMTILLRLHMSSTARPMLATLVIPPRSSFVPPCDLCRTLLQPSTRNTSLR